MTTTRFSQNTLCTFSSMFNMNQDHIFVLHPYMQAKYSKKTSSHLFKHLILNILLCGTFPGEGHDQLNDPFIDKIRQLLLVYEILQYKDFTLDENTDVDTTCLAVACKD